MSKNGLFGMMTFIVGVMLPFTMFGCDTGKSSGGTSILPEGIDKEFLIYVNGSDEWTPFPGKSGVSFENSDSGILNTTDNSIKIEFVGKAVGESVITATHENIERKALVKVRAIEGGTITYRYDAPVNFYYEYVNYTKGGSYDESDIHLEAYLNGAYTHNLSGTNYLFHYVGTNAYGYDGSKWVIDEMAEPDEVQGVIEEASSNPFPLNLYYTIIDSTAAGSFININDYYKGKETVCGISCWVIDLGNYGGASERYKFWINPANGHTLKMEMGESNNRDVTEVLKYNPDLKAWPDGLKP